jgi:hypothetical protein
MEALDYARELSYPRKVGTPGERKAVSYIEDRFRNFGIQVELQDFRFSLLPFNLWLRVALLLQGLLVLLTTFWAGFSVPLLLLICFYSKWTRILRPIDGKGSSRNVIGRIKTSSKWNLIISAHYDSKSQLFPLGIRAILFIISVGGCFIFAIFVLVSSIFLSPEIFLYPALILSLLSLSLIFNTTGNSSDGANDNASGLGVLLATAEHFSRNPPRNIDLIFLATGAEEVGLCGSFAFLKSFQGNAYLINLDGVGLKKLIYNTGYGIPPKLTSRKLAGLLEEICRERKIEIKGFYLPTGAAADHLPWVEKRYEATSIHSLDPWAHSKRDKIARIRKETLDDCTLLVREMIRRIDGFFD